GAQSMDGGKTWSKNRMIYTSPDSTVCQCCKPSVKVAGSNVYVMFRNWIDGNRDMYIIQSKDGGNTFDDAKRLGDGHWKLKGCPMDGGNLAINTNGQIQTVWRREGMVFSATPGSPEIQIGEGKGSTIETINGKNIYAWTKKDEVEIIKPGGEKVSIGKGNQPVLKALNDHQVMCVWEQQKQIHAAIVEL
ncbi:MAG: sialidase family protein, partial [Ferruginibacter sp.]